MHRSPSSHRFLKSSGPGGGWEICCLEHPLQTLKNTLSLTLSFCSSFSPCRPHEQKVKLWQHLFQMSHWHRMLMVWVGPYTNLTAKTQWGPLSEAESMVIMRSEFWHCPRACFTTSILLLVSLSISCKLILFCLQKPLLQLSFILFQNFPPQPFFFLQFPCILQTFSIQLCLPSLFCCTVTHFNSKYVGWHWVLLPIESPGKPATSFES